MKERRIRGLSEMKGIALACVLGLVSGCASTGSDGLEGAESDSVRARGVPGEGITVHGHWTIEVRDPDGTLAERREFENELLGGGVGAMVDILGRISTPGDWEIWTSSAAHVCQETAGPGGDGVPTCMIVEATA